MIESAIDWSKINTVIIVAAATFIWRQMRTVDQLRQALIGYGGHGGVIDEVKLLRETLERLTARLGETEVRMAMWDGVTERRKAG